MGMSEKQQQTYDLFQKLGNKTAVAREMGVSETSVRRMLKRAEKWNSLDSGISGAMGEVGLQNLDRVHSGWLKTEGASVYFQMPKDNSPQFDDFVTIVREAFGNIPARKPIKKPTTVNSNLCTFYNIIDHHLAMHSWGKETGEDYDLQIGIDRLVDCMGQLIQSAPKSGTAVVLNMGDFFHMDDSNNQTPQSKHALDVDGRYFKVISAGVALTVACIDMALEKHESVVYRALRGNHDIHAHVALTVALDHHYRDCDNVTIEVSASDFFVFEWGRNMVCAHHGDKAKAERLVMFMADNYAEMWGRTHWRFMWTGHIHHDSAKDIGGAIWESFRTLAPKDAYAASHAYSARQTMQAITMDKDCGEILRNKVQIIPPKFR